jgi:putative heme-binding domain-containing protein
MFAFSPRAAFEFTRHNALRALVVATLLASASRCLADDSQDGIAALVQLLNDIDDAEFQLDLLKGIQEGLRGRRQIEMPSAWPDLYASKLASSPNSDVRARARALAVTFGDPEALASLREIIHDADRSTSERRSALQSLAGVRPPGFADDLLVLLNQSDLNDLAIRSLAEQVDDRVPPALLAAYPGFDRARRHLALDALSGRIPFAKAMLAALEHGTIPRSDVTSDIIRKLELLGDDSLRQAVAESWGKTRLTPAEKQRRIAELKEFLTADSQRSPDLAHGRALFSRTCQQCHRLFGEGAEVGPEITGSHRANLDYLLLNVVYPNAAVGKDYQAWNIATDDGRVLVGLVVNETGRTLTLQTSTDTLAIDKNEIEERLQTDVSMMPEGLLDQLTNEELQDLVAYLASPIQVALPTE